MSVSTDFRIKQRLVIRVFDTEYCHWRRILGSTLWPGKQKAIHGISSSSMFSECKEIQNCSISKKSHALHLFGCKGLLYTEFLTKGSTVNSDRYCATLRSLKQRIRRIRPERNTFLLHYDNARPHCSAQTQDAITSLKFTVVPHSPYSPDLAPSDFWLFPKLKETLKGQKFSLDAEVYKLISSQPETFFMDGIKKWIERLKKMCSRKWWLCWKVIVQCVREINFFHSDITVIILHCQKLISQIWRHYLSITPRIFEFECRRARMWENKSGTRDKKRTEYNLDTNVINVKTVNP